VHLRSHGATNRTIISAYYYGGKRFDVTAEHISAALKMAARVLEYPILKGIPIKRINTHSLRSGDANALALSGYSDTQIQKIGRWCGATFKEYVRNELACFSTGMSSDMKKKFGFVNVSGNAFSDITDACINADYSAPLPLAVLLPRSVAISCLREEALHGTVLSLQSFWHHSQLSSPSSLCILPCIMPRVAYEPRSSHVT